jgi:DNA invertase Pin-like site-specific DNA recombinase
MPALSLALVLATPPVEPPPSPRGILRGSRPPPDLLAPADAPGYARELHLRASQYLRMSTDHQQYSTANQHDAIARYAADHGLEVVRTYADEGRSGLTVRGRPGLCSLLEDIASGRADYRTVLVFDVSRWGRFQDSDEAACYEFLCRRAGIRVEYCAEPFVNDASAVSSVVKGLKRMMAGEYSRELSEKVFAGKCRLVSLGFSQGSRAPFGLRRVLVDAHGAPRGTLEFGEQKFVTTDRVRFVPGPPAEVRVLRWVFRQVADHGRKLEWIARDLNRRGVRPPGVKPWNGQRVLLLLTNEKYIGNLVFNRSSCRLRSPKVRLPRERWVRKDGAIEPVVSRGLFERAQARMAGWSTRVSNEAALAKLRALLAKRRTLNSALISAEPGMPGPAFYRARFGRLTEAYRLVGYAPARDWSFLDGLVRRRRLALALRAEVVQGLRERGVPAVHRGIAVLARDRMIGVLICRAQVDEGRSRWRVQVPGGRGFDRVLIGRLGRSEEVMTDYWMVPPGSYVSLDVKNRRPGDRVSATTLSPLLDSLARAG